MLQLLPRPGSLSLSALAGACVSAEIELKGKCFATEACHYYFWLDLIMIIEESAVDGLDSSRLAQSFQPQRISTFPERSCLRWLAG